MSLSLGFGFNESTARISSCTSEERKKKEDWRRRVPSANQTRGAWRGGEKENGKPGFAPRRPPPLYTRQPKRGGDMCVCLAYALPPPLSCVRAGESVYVPPLPLAAGRGADGGGGGGPCCSNCKSVRSVGRGGAAGF